MVRDDNCETDVTGPVLVYSQVILLTLRRLVRPFAFRFLLYLQNLGGFLDHPDFPFGRSFSAQRQWRHRTRQENVEGGEDGSVDGGGLGSFGSRGRDERRAAGEERTCTMG